MSAIEGGVPIIECGKIIGAIGVSGGWAAQNGVVATAGAAVIKYSRGTPTLPSNPCRRLKDSSWALRAQPGNFLPPDG